MDLLVGEARPFQANHVQPLGRDIEIGVEEIWRYIAVHASVAAYHGKASNFRILVDDDTAGNEGLIFDLDIPGDKSATGNHRVVPNRAVVRNVARSHDVIFIAD